MLLGMALHLTAAVRQNVTPRIYRGPPIFPRPKDAKFSADSFAFDDKTVIVIGKSRLDLVAGNVVAREIQARGGLRPTITRERLIGRYVIALGEPDSLQWLKREDAAHIPANNEGYWLKIDPKSAHRPAVIVAGRTPQSTLYGAQTLCQLIRKEKGVSALGATVRDYPSLAWRGAHLFLGEKALHFHKKLIANVLARFKMNRLVLECEQVKWHALGKVAPEWGMSKRDLGKELRYARAFGLEPVPLVSSISHMKWLLTSGPFKDLREDPDSPLNISPGDPRTYKILFSIYKEVLQAFRPDALHIGADEVLLTARYPYRSASKFANFQDAYTAQVTRLHDYLKARGVRTMMWADPLFPPGKKADPAKYPTAEAAESLRKRLPKDMQLVDWHYNPGGETWRLHLLELAGFHSIVGAIWLNPEAAHAYARELTDRGHAGLLQTTWVGYQSQEKNIHTYPDTFAAFIVAADEAWNGGTIPADRLAYRPRDVLEKAYALPMP